MNASSWPPPALAASAPAAQNDAAAESVSVVVPFCDEAGNVAPLFEHLHAALRALPYPWELVAVDDGSEDETLAQLRAQALRFGAHVRVIELQRNFGQTAAMQAGFEAARGTLVVTLDGDGQNDPDDIPPMIETLRARDLDLLVGWRHARRDDALRTTASHAANRLIARVTGVHLHDYGCSLKVYRAHVLRQVPLYGEMHRFIPALLATVIPPRRIGEIRVRHHERRHGTSKYGMTRTFRVLVDLLAVYFFLRFSSRPGHFFGVIGLALGGVGMAMLAWLAFVKLALGQDIGGRPLLDAGILCALAGLQMLTTGVLAEMLLRVSYRHSSTRCYAIRNAGECERHPAEGWMGASTRR